MKAQPTTSNSPRKRSPKRGRSRERLKPNQDEANLAGAGAVRPVRAARKQLPVYRASAAGAPGAAGAPITNGASGKGHCTACGLCCSYVAIETDAPSTAKRATQLLWYVYHEGVSLYVNEDEWMVQFETTCRYLQPDYRCGIYTTRPHICREFNEQDCEVNTGDDGRTFYTGAEFLEHLKETRPRVHSLVMRGFSPPPEAARGEKTPFEQRFAAVHSRRAALGL
jgi:Fe-S-cluster containining protein